MIRLNKSFIQPKDFPPTRKRFSIQKPHLVFQLLVGWLFWTLRSGIHGPKQIGQGAMDGWSLLATSQKFPKRIFKVCWQALGRSCSETTIGVPIRPVGATIEWFRIQRPQLPTRKTSQGDIYLHFQRLRLNFETKRSKPDCRNGISVESCISSESTVD